MARIYCPIFDDKKDLIDRKDRITEGMNVGPLCRCSKVDILHCKKCQKAYYKAKVT